MESQTVDCSSKLTSSGSRYQEGFKQPFPMKWRFWTLGSEPPKDGSLLQCDKSTTKNYENVNKSSFDDILSSNLINESNLSIRMDWLGFGFESDWFVYIWFKKWFESVFLWKCFESPHKIIVKGSRGIIWTSRRWRHSTVLTITSSQNRFNR